MRGVWYNKCNIIVREYMEKEELLRKYFKKDRYVELSGIEIAEMGAEKCVVCAKIEEKHLNANGRVQGGMLYTLADFAFAICSNYLHPITVTQGGHIQYVRAAVTTTLTATAKETLRVGHNTLCEVIITDDKGDVVCVCNFNGFVKDVDWETFEDKFIKE